MIDVFCALASADAGEPLIGSAASDTDRWLLIEHERPWAAKPLASEGLGPVREQLAAWDGAPRHRLQLIRRPERKPGDGVRVYVGFSGEDGPWLRAFDLGSLEELAGLDLEAVTPAASEAEAGPLHLVCTHGKRDRCCAKWGMPVYQALVAAAPGGRVWQTSHTGGHRFAANVLSFPQGVSYGRVEPGEAAALAAAHREGRLHSLERLRGRTCYAAPAQAAELAVRRALHQRALGALRQVGFVALDEGRWQVRFEVDGAVHVAEVTRRVHGPPRPKSCGDEPVPIERYDVQLV